MTILAKFSDYRIQPVEYFIDAITTDLALRDITNLTNGKVNKVNVSKQHPLAVLMQATLNEGGSPSTLRSSLIPAISVIPGSQPDGGFTFGQSFHSEIVDDDFMEELESYLTKTNKEILELAILTKAQVATIITAYAAGGEGSIICNINEWRKAEELNISLWSDTPDIDNLFATILDSILASIQVGSPGDESPVQNMSYRITRGLTNFNFGRVLFGSEYSVTYTNTYRNYVLISDPRVYDHEANFTFEVPGE